MQTGGAVFIFHWGSEVRSYLYSGFIKKLLDLMPVTIMSRVVDAEFVDLVPAGATVVKTPDFEVPKSFCRLHALGNTAHGNWRASRGEFVSSEFYAFKPKAASLLGRMRRSLSPVVSNRLGLRSIDALQRRFIKTTVDFAKPVVDLLNQLEPRIIMTPDYMNTSTIAIVLAAQSLGVKSIALPQNWNNIYKCARVFLECDRQLVWNDRMRQFVVERNPHLRPDDVVAVGTPQFDLHTDESLILPRREFARHIGFDPDRPYICYSAAAPKTVQHEARILQGFIEATTDAPLFGNPQMVIRLNPIGSDPGFGDLVREYPDCYACEPGWDVRRDVSWICSSYSDVRVWMNLVYHSAVNISVPSTVTLDFAGMDKPVVNVGYDPPGADSPAVSLGDLWKQDIYRPIVDLGAVKIASSQDELVDLVDAYLRNPSSNREERRRLMQAEFAGHFGSSGDRIMAEIRVLLTQAPKSKPRVNADSRVLGGQEDQRSC